MLSVQKTGPNRVDIELTAVLDAEMMAAGLDELVEVSQGISDGVIMYRIPSFSLPTGGALMAEMLRLPSLFEAIRHFSRCAVVTDFGWIRTAAQAEGAIMPGLTIKSFGAQEAHAAEAWLMAVEDDEEDPNVPV